MNNFCDKLVNELFQEKTYLGDIQFLAYLILTITWELKTKGYKTRVSNLGSSFAINENQDYCLRIKR